MYVSLANMAKSLKIYYNFEETQFGDTVCDFEK